MHPGDELIVGSEKDSSRWETDDFIGNILYGGGCIVGVPVFEDGDGIVAF